jgi:hypothetical protein
MPLLERSLVLLNHVKFVDSIGELGSEQNDLIKATFKKILSSGDTYKIDEIENWLCDTCVTNPAVIERILNIAHYEKAKFDAKNPLKMTHDSCGCGGDC